MEEEILKLLEEGLSPEQVAAKLGLEVKIIIKIKEDKDATRRI